MNSKASASLSSDSLFTAIGRGPTPARWHADPQNGWSPAHDVPSHLVSVFCQFHSVHWRSVLSCASVGQSMLLHGRPCQLHQDCNFNSARCSMHTLRRDARQGGTATKEVNDGGGAGGGQAGGHGAGAPVVHHRRALRQQPVVRRLPYHQSPRRQLHIPPQIRPPAARKLPDQQT